VVVSDDFDQLDTTIETVEQALPEEDA